MRFEIGDSVYRAGVRNAEFQDPAVESRVESSSRVRLRLVNDQDVGGSDSIVDDAFFAEHRERIGFRFPADFES